MARLKKTTSPVYDVAVVRAAAIRSIDENFDSGTGVTLALYDAAIERVEKTRDDYNKALSNLDELKVAFEDSELILRDLHERILASVVAQYGKYSIQYEKAGGKKRKTRRASVKIAATARP